MKYLVGWLEEMPELKVNGNTALELKTRVFETRTEAERFLLELEANPKAEPFLQEGFCITEVE